MILLDEQNEQRKRGVATDITLWQRNQNGNLIILYMINNTSK